MATPPKIPTSFTLAEPEIVVVWASLLSLVKGDARAAEKLSEEQRDAAKVLLDRMTRKLENPSHEDRRRLLRQRASQRSLGPADA